MGDTKIVDHTPAETEVVISNYGENKVSTNPPLVEK